MRPSTPSGPPNPGSAPATPGGGWRTPEPGDVLSYAYLWAREAAAGQEEGLKDRPAVVVLAGRQTSSRTEIIVAPVTHSPPVAPQDAVEMPAVVKRDLGLDRDRSWIVLTEVNRFRWPGPDVQPLKSGDPYYGAIPDWLFLKVRDGLAALANRKGTKITRRTE